MEVDPPLQGKQKHVLFDLTQERARSDVHIFSSGFFPQASNAGTKAQPISSTGPYHV